MGRAIKKLNIKINRNLTFLILFVVGVIIGSIFANYLDPSQKDELGILNNYFLDKYSSITLNHIDLLRHIVLNRIRIVLYIWFFGLTFFGIPTIVIALLYFGISFGFMLSLGTIVYGSKGILLNLVFLFPHFLIYVPLVLYLIHKSFELCATLYYKKLAATKSYRLNNKQLFTEYILVLLLCTLVIIIGALVETFVNPGIVRWMIQRI
ncbi:stage II sporulation protein M [Natranaerovirga pectinivora]|uniref:Stage II sporulation protein M n=1 Tax=Natranaerovirga pectinivora TaxID=682400 RepID=A0A4R3MKN6_9FIRM|nr:stage II sporulation protein M [Natranaerovirga pectinivora]TCT15023.1 stage II sporulation protein M [Natranaerovirga pectinivora]